MERELAGRVALVTGCGNPLGIGMACARILGREGANLAITSTSDRIHERGDELRSLGHEVETAVADLTDRHDVGSLVATVERRYGRVDVLVNKCRHDQRGVA